MRDMMWLMEELTPCGDVELFYVERDDWSLPIYATPYRVGDRDLFLVTPALALLHRPMEALLSVLEPAWLARDKDLPRFWFLRSVLPEVAKKAPGVTPRYYFKWNNVWDTGRFARVVAEFHEQQEVTETQEDFLRYIVNHTSLLTLPQVKIMWRALSQCGARWLAVEKKPIDFGLFTVTPLPYRRNWKERIYQMMSQRVKGRAPRVFLEKMRKKDERDEYAKEHLESVLCDTTLMAVDQARHYCRWHLELKESDGFGKYVAETEADIRKKRGAVSYARKTLRSIQERRVAILDALSTWVKEINRPCGAVDEQRNDGSQAIVPLKKPGRLVVRPPRHPDVPVVLDDGPMLFGPVVERVDKTLAVGLRSVSDLLPKKGNLRFGGPGDGTPVQQGVDSAGGVPVPDVGEDANANGAVLDGGNNGWSH